MKEQYIKQVEKELSLPHKAKKEIESALGFDVLQIILAVGFAAAVIAVLLIIRTIHKNRR